MENNWNELTSAQKADVLKDELQKTIDQFNKRFDLFSDEIGNLTARLNELSAKIANIQNK